MPVSDKDLQHWVKDRYGFLPLAEWIAHCRELYLHEPAKQRDSLEECPLDKRAFVWEAFVYFGLLADQQRAMVGSRM